MNLVDGERSLEAMAALRGEGRTELLLPLKRAAVLLKISSASRRQLMCGGGLPDESPSIGGEITGAIRIDQLARLWLAEKADESMLPQTLDRYETSLRARLGGGPRTSVE